jgi:hypothetical protein
MVVQLRQKCFPACVRREIRQDLGFCSSRMRSVVGVPPVPEAFHILPRLVRLCCSKSRQLSGHGLIIDII